MKPTTPEPGVRVWWYDLDKEAVVSAVVNRVDARGYVHLARARVGTMPPAPRHVTEVQGDHRGAVAEGLRVLVEARRQLDRRIGELTRLQQEGPQPCTPIYILDPETLLLAHQEATGCSGP